MKCAIVFLCFVGVVLSAPPKPRIENVPRAGEEYRLTTEVLPSKYEVTLKPYFEARNFEFDGHVLMTIRAQQAGVLSFTFHKSDMEINENLEKIYRANDPNSLVPITNRMYDETTHKYTIVLESALIQDQDYVYESHYVGHMRDDMHGFYRSSYINSQGQTKWIGTTQMQPTHARRVFPCFDEPLFKATFIVRMSRPNSYKVTVSNTRLVETTDDGTDRKLDVFTETPKMSTYLLAFIVSEFEERADNLNRMFVVSRAEAFSQTEYALDEGVKLLNEFNTYFGYNYYTMMISKMHMAAIPDFSAGAMENWGLLTYRETALLYDPDVSSSMAQQRVATVIAHEQIHMWFGDLVTCEWWGYTWLNEGFARYFQYFGTAMVETNWGLEDQFVVDQLQVVFASDSVSSTHPLNHVVNSPSEVSNMFSTISYNKGASVIRMTRHIMGETKFRDGLRTYLRENAMSVSTPDKLYTHLQAQADGTTLDVKQFLSKWTDQEGYPVVTAKLGSDKRTLQLSQKRFFIDGTTDSKLWDVPITYTTSSSPSFTNTAPGELYLREAAQNITMNLDADWIIMNIQQTGYYRVNYDDDTWDKISAALKDENKSGIHVLNRAQLVDDIMNLARAGMVNYARAFTLLEYLEDEMDYTPWVAFFRNLDYVFKRIDDMDLKDKYIRKLSKKVYDTLTFYKKTSDTRLQIYNRANIVSRNCLSGREDCISDAQKEFQRLHSGESGYSVEVDSRATVYCTAVREGGADQYNFLWQKFLTENVAAEQVLLLSSLACTKDNSRIIDFIGKVLSTSVRLQDKSAAFTAIYTNNLDKIDHILDYVIENHAKISEAFQSTGNVVTILRGLADRFTKQSQITKLESFASANSAYASSLTSTISSAKYDLEWSNKNLETITDYIKDYNSAAAITTSFLMIMVSVLVALFNQ